MKLKVAKMTLGGHATFSSSQEWWHIDPEKACKGGYTPQ